MFKRNNAILQRKQFSLTSDKIVEDIEAIGKDEAQQDKLYHCLNEKLPQEHRFKKIDEFLKGAKYLDEISEKLADTLYEVNSLSKSMTININKLREDVTTVISK